MNENDAKRFKSDIWNTFNRIYGADDKEIKNFYYCVTCKSVFHADINKSGTNALRRHKCVTLNQSTKITSFLTKTSKKIEEKHKKDVLKSSCFESTCFL